MFAYFPQQVGRLITTKQSISVLNVKCIKSFPKWKFCFQNKTYKLSFKVNLGIIQSSMLKSLEKLERKYEVLLLRVSCKFLFHSTGFRCFISVIF